MKSLLFGVWSTDIGLLLTRLFIGGMMMFGHGLGKLSNFSAIADSFPDPLGIGSAISLALAVFAEFFCSLLLALGLMTRLVLVPLMITMFVAAFIVHGDDPFAKKELALLYFFSYAALFFTGPGGISVDSKIYQGTR